MEKPIDAHIFKIRVKRFKIFFLSLILIYFIFIKKKKMKLMKTLV